MPLEKWSDDTVVVHLADDPQFSEDLRAVEELLGDGTRNGVFDFSAVGFVNSSNLAHLLRVRREVVKVNGRMILCGIGDELWGALLVTSLDKIFECADDVSTSLATLQLTSAR